MRRNYGQAAPRPARANKRSPQYKQLAVCLPLFNEWGLNTNSELLDIGPHGRNGTVANGTDFTRPEHGDRNFQTLYGVVGTGLTTQRILIDFTGLGISQRDCTLTFRRSGPFNTSGDCRLWDANPETFGTRIAQYFTAVTRVLHVVNAGTSVYTMPATDEIVVAVHYKSATEADVYANGVLQGTETGITSLNDEEIGSFQFGNRQTEDRAVAGYMWDLRAYYGFPGEQVIWDMWDSPFDLIVDEGRTTVAVKAPAVDNTPPPVAGSPSKGGAVGRRMIANVGTLMNPSVGGPIQGHCKMDGIASSLVYDARVEGPAAGTEMAFAIFFRADDITVQANNVIWGGEDETTRIRFDSTGLMILSSNGFSIPSTAAAISSATWHCAMGNGECNVDASAQMYVDDANVKDTSSAAAATITWKQRFGLGGGVYDGDGTFSGLFGLSLGPVLIWHDSQVDWSVEATRRLILNADGMPDYKTLAGDLLGFNGIEPTVALNQKPAKFPVNLSSNSNLGIEGALGDANLPIQVTMP